MATPYAPVGTPVSAQSPSPAPTPGSSPVVAIPDDTDALNAASVAQMVKVPTDYLTYLQQTANWRPPLQPNGLTGFTSVTHSGSGTGTVTPASASQTLLQRTIAPVSVVVKIIAGGAVGTATFQISLDGGNSFGSTITTAATYRDPNSFITMTFSGTFTIGDRYAFSPTDCPRAAFLDRLGNPGHVIDHNGLMTGKGARFEETWAYFLDQNTVGSNNVCGNRWNAYTTDATSEVLIKSPTLSYACRFVDMTPGTVTSKAARIAAAAGMFSPGSTGICLAMEFDIGMNAVGANGLTAWWGLSSGVAPEAGGVDLLAFYWISSGVSNGVTGGNLAFQYGPSGGITTVALNYQPTAGAEPNIRCRIEYYGPGSPYGNGARVFLNGSLAAIISSGLPAGGPGPLFPFFGTESTTTAGCSAFIGHVRAAWDVWATPELL